MMSVLLCIMLACVPYAYCGDTTMIALVADSYVGNDYNQLKLGPVALPPAATEGTARIQIVASSVNPPHRVSIHCPLSGQPHRLAHRERLYVTPSYTFPRRIAT